MVSTPVVKRYSGWPGVLQSSWRNCWMSSRLTASLPVGLPSASTSFTPRQVEQRVEQHRRMADRQHEAVAVGPVGCRGIVAQEVAPQRVADRRQAPSACPGGRELAFCTASIDSVRIVSMARRSGEPSSATDVEGRKAVSVSFITRVPGSAECARALPPRTARRKGRFRSQCGFVTLSRRSTPAGPPISSASISRRNRPWPSIPGMSERAAASASGSSIGPKAQSIRILP